MRRLVSGTGQRYAAGSALVGANKETSYARDYQFYAATKSGECDPQLGITRAGNRYARSLLVECAHKILPVFTPDSALKQWGLKLAARGGKHAKKRAIVAVARKLAVVLHRMRVKQERFEPFREARLQSATAGS